MQKKFGKVAVLYGGNSSEREVSLESGKAVYDALVAAGVDAHLIDTKNHQEVLDLKKNSFDRAFIALHGRGGEDGEIQGLLDWIDMPYTGSGVCACAVAMDKLLCKKIWKSCDLPVLADCEVKITDTYEEISAKLGGKTLAVKPAYEGSSVGISRVTCAEEWQAALEKAGIGKQKVMAEIWCSGREITVGIIGEEVLPSIEIIVGKNHLFYDKNAKYDDNATQYLCPAPVAENIAEKLADIAKKSFTAIGAKGWGRVDFLLDGENIWILEINLSPGMTSHSLVPQAAAKVGMDFQKLVVNLLEIAGKNENI
ncbi:MAG: D-alanine--D-alanine ligase [Cardiobacteriaceae bacterium]|nr:D-alanine--D-alanine ligase [Cardiobacteriaceae bacterium]